jgi:hypothetical protein
MGAFVIVPPRAGSRGMKPTPFVLKEEVEEPPSMPEEEESPGIEEEEWCGRPPTSPLSRPMKYPPGAREEWCRSGKSFPHPAYVR